ncbi:NTP pyrophosphohydrolase [Aeropyrum camini SY1 = JCM 12091]|uniref:NTP pyrophosphohydrolase n=1 Tax=Aeropyrum camini SY1 = JCM 12091 TaxID=1198449 RepID=U3TF14_9CREN|nr:NTP pyrophosphohydrolase [Aeropyrum camini SY1 = JCM 12091]
MLALLWGRPTRVLLVRKRCAPGSPWACDLALPGGGVEAGETPLETALREAWEEARIPPAAAKPLASYCCEKTLTAGRRIYIVIAELRGPAEPRPGEEEVDAAIWAPLHIAAATPTPVRHPYRGIVEGLRLPGGLILWGATYRILRRLLAMIQDGEVKLNTPQHQT